MDLIFKTDDGYTFTYEDGEWTDGDLFFGTNPNGPEGISGPLTGKLGYSEPTQSCARCGEVKTSAKFQRGVCRECCKVQSPWV